MVDRFSRWPEVYPLKDVSSEACCEAFLHNWLPRFGIPDVIVTDRGSQFVAGKWQEMMTALGIQTISTTAYHPQCNGLVERMHRQLKASIRARLDNSDWHAALPFVLLGLRSAWRHGPDAAPSELVYGSLLRLPGEFITNNEITSSSSMSPFLSSLQARMRAQRAAPSDHHSSPSAPYIPSDLGTATMVFVRHDGVKRPLQPPYDGPYPVLEPGSKVFKILRNGLPYTCLLYTSPSPRD